MFNPSTAEQFYAAFKINNYESFLNLIFEICILVDEVKITHTLLNAQIYVKSDVHPWPYIHFQFSSAFTFHTNINKTIKGFQDELIIFN